MKTFLHIGCGYRSQQQTTSVFALPEWQEIRIDINADAQPHIRASVTDMSAIADASADAVYLCHIIEHIFAHEVPVALREISRILKPEGFALIRCPDMQGIAQLIAEDRLNDPIYNSLIEGPITPHDMVYGHTRSLARGELGMAHRCGFTAKTLVIALTGNGFNTAVIDRRGMSGQKLELWTLAIKQPRPRQDMVDMLAQHTIAARNPI